ncbi:MAG: FG-GAP-like repeat-containing protein [bacterium]
MKRVLLVLIMFLFETASAQQWLWVQEDRVLNPSGVDIRNNSAQFQVLDWNHDSLWDFVINQEGVLELYQQVAGQPPVWELKKVDFPQIGFNADYSGPLPKNFEFIDWDSDGDYDLAADSSLFWWNLGSNASPRWVQDDSLLAGIEGGFDFFFVDYDGDGDWDATAEPKISPQAAFFLNEGSNRQPLWTKNDSLLPPGQAARFVQWDSDHVLDLALVTDVPVTDSPLMLELSPFLNQGDALNPKWERRKERILLWIATTSATKPAYDIVDFDYDSLLDVVKTDWKLHVAVHSNHGTSDSTGFLAAPDLLLGPINVTSKATPAFFDADADGFRDLVVTEDIVLYFSLDFFTDGRIRAYENLNGHFDPGFQLKENVPKVRFTFQPNLKKSLTLSFADVDKDGDQDYLLGFIRTNGADMEVGTGILYFQNKGTATEPNWQADTTRFTSFLQPDSLFYAPQLVDIDHDGDLDLFLQRQEEYTFYERLDTAEESWQENRAWLMGVNSRRHHQAVFVDLTRDGKEDLVFGEEDGTLVFYENVGTSAWPQWQLVENVFGGIDVGFSAAPAFADVSGDGLADLVVGNAEGRLFYFRNESTVAVAAQPEAGPTDFRLFQNYPNPFNPETEIRYDLPAEKHVTLTIYNLLGQRIKTLVDETQKAGSYSLRWDGTDAQGKKLPSGVYLYRLEAGRFVRVKKMLVVR